VAELLAPYCRANGIKSLEIFGSVARGTARRGSDVDLIVTFDRPLGLRFFGMADDMAELLNAPVDLLTSNRRVGSRRFLADRKSPLLRWIFFLDSQEKDLLPVRGFSSPLPSVPVS
jgi:predicted nucleotidyltransferase